MFDFVSIFNAFAVGFCMFAVLYHLREGNDDHALASMFMAMINLVLILIRIPH